MQQFVYANEGRILLREAAEDDILGIYEMYEGVKTLTFGGLIKS